MKTRYYTIEQYLLKNGTQPARIHEYFSRHRIPGIKKVHKGPMLVLEAVAAPHMPQVMFLTGFESLDQLASVMAKVAQDQDLMHRYNEWEKGPEPPFETQHVMVIEAAPYSPELVVERREKPRIFEWRVYQSPTFSQLSALHQRFAGPEIKIFHRVGIEPVLYASTLIGPNIPNLTYFIPFDSLDAREKAWARFAADEEWIKVRKESIDKHGQISAQMQISLWKTTPYSPVS